MEETTKSFSFKITQQLPLLLLFLFFVVTLQFKLSTLVMPGYSFYDIQRSLELSLLIATALYTILNIKHQSSIFFYFPSTTHLLLSTLLLIGICSTAIAPLPRYAFLEVSLDVLLFSFTLTLATARIHAPKIFDHTILILLISCIFLYLLTFYTIYVIEFIHHNTIHQFPGFMNPSFFSQFSLCTLPLICLPLFYYRNCSLFWRILLWLIVIGWWSLVPFEKSKGLYLSLFIGYFFTGCFFRRQSILWFTQQIPFIFFGFLIPSLLIFFAPHLSPVNHPLLTNQLSNLSRPVLTNQMVPMNISATAHIALWQQSLLLLKTHLILGVGPMHFAYYINPHAAHPHNSLLLIATEWGIFAAVISTFLLLSGGYHWLKRFNHQTILSHSPTRFLTQSLTAAFLSGTIYSLTNGMIVMPLSQIIVCIILGWMLGLYYGNKDLSLTNGWSFFIFAIITLIAIGGVIVGVYPAVTYLPDHEIHWYLSHHKFFPKFFPRFWLQGWLR